MSKVDALDYTFSPVPFGFEKKRGVFVNRFLHKRNPDRNADDMLHARGEFSVHTEIAFSRYLKKMVTN